MIDPRMPQDKVPTKWLILGFIAFVILMFLLPWD